MLKIIATHILDILALLISGFNVVLTWKIFHKGLKLNKDKVLTRVCLEFVTAFIIPFYDFNIATKIIWEHQTEKVSTVLDILRNNHFTVTFPYYDTHVGDVWDSLASCKGMKQEDAFKAIETFVHHAKAFDRGVSDLCEHISQLKDKENDSWEVTWVDFINQYGGTRLSDGKKLIQDLYYYIQQLPQELQINTMVNKLRRY